ncbi:ATP-binding cassette domain-containing protein [Rhodobacteraceae bacterium 2CG4]|uniref:ATP-binding cassette domain-containing protein n=1 Tax=Halovulum marinum TaxID=2662447 RepID=A0A6L5Z3E3_9RHOB|nr:ABC transporter ATP-binding protein [Halovulum marinum]MSU90595.1 ATP-binding cassette domain-containing protein [Halovulum marinum]
MTGLCVQDLSFSYGPRQALDGVGFSACAGDFCALLGPNGAGKTTLFALMTRLFATRSGRIEIAGHDLSRDRQGALAALGVVFQQPTLDLDLSVRQNLAYFLALHGVSGRVAGRRIDAALEKLGMADRAAEKVRALNGGHRRRAEIARALSHGPNVLLLDEPTVGLDAASRASITDEVHALARDRGVTVLWATHLTDEVRDEDRLIVLHRGRVLADTTGAGFRGRRSLSDAFLDATGERP